MFTLACFAEDNVVVYWLKRIGNGDNLNEPHAPYSILTKEISTYIRKIGSPKPNSFLTCMSILDENYMYERDINGVSIKDFQLKDVQRDIIAKVIARRSPIINEFDFDKKIYPEGLPKYIYRVGSIIQEDYWGMFQFCVINNLIKENDTRFESEVKNLLDYLLAPLPVGKSRSNYNEAKMERADARWASPLGMQKRLITKSIEYLNLFRQSRNEDEIDPYVDTTHLIAKYHFGKNCDYYKQGKWGAFLKGPPTEKEMRRFHEISRQWRENSKKRFKENEKIMDEVTLMNAEETLKQPNLSAQEREYLERRINFIKNKKYEDN
jgi:hypothetical protein